MVWLRDSAVATFRSGALVFPSVPMAMRVVGVLSAVSAPRPGLGRKGGLQCVNAFLNLFALLM